MAAACGEQYCQSGPKYGGQCYTINQVEWQESQVRSAPPPERSIEPSQGCVLATPTGDYTVPPPVPSTTPAPAKPNVYLMSGACVTRREPVHGATK